MIQKTQMLIRCPEFIKTAFEDLKETKGGSVNQYVNNALLLYLTLIGKTPELDTMLDKIDWSVKNDMLDIRTLFNFKG